MAFTLPALPYAPAALEPHIDALTMQIHHDKHHQAYVDNLNKAIAGTPNENKSLEDLVSIAGTLPPAIRNNGGGHWNHSFFWLILAPNAGGKPSGKTVGIHRCRFWILSMLLKKNLPWQVWVVLVADGHGS